MTTLTAVHRFGKHTIVNSKARASILRRWGALYPSICWKHFLRWKARLNRISPLLQLVTGWQTKRLQVCGHHNEFAFILRNVYKLEISHGGRLNTFCNSAGRYLIESTKFSNIRHRCLRCCLVWQKLSCTCIRLSDEALPSSLLTYASFKGVLGLNKIHILHFSKN